MAENIVLIYGNVKGKFGKIVRWVEPTGRANARPMTGSAKPINFASDKGNGFRFALPILQIVAKSAALPVPNRGRAGGV